MSVVSLSSLMACFVSLGGQIIPVSCEFEQNLFEMKDDPEAQKGKVSVRCSDCVTIEKTTSQLFCQQHS